MLLAVELALFEILHIRDGRPAIVEPKLVAGAHQYNGLEIPLCVPASQVQILLE